jgi:hypothetical protein
VREASESLAGGSRNSSPGQALPRSRPPFSGDADSGFDSLRADAGCACRRHRRANGEVRFDLQFDRVARSAKKRHKKHTCEPCKYADQATTQTGPPTTVPNRNAVTASKKLRRKNLWQNALSSKDSTTSALNKRHFAATLPAASWSRAFFPLHARLIAYSQLYARLLTPVPMAQA